MSGRSDVEVTIDELVLHGFSPSSGHTVADAVQAELARLFTDGGIPPHLRSIAWLSATCGTQPSNERPAAAGRAVARAVYDGMGERR